MAFLVKNRQNRPATGSQTGQATIDETIQVSRAAATLPATTAQNIFQVFGGRVLVKALVGTVTTVVQAQVNSTKVSATAKDASGATVGTAVDIATGVDISALEVGGSIFVGGDGGAAIKSNAGAIAAGSKIGTWIAPQGIISYTTAATNTGAMKWDIWFQPLDATAYVVAL